MRHDVLDVELEQRLDWDLVVHEYAGAAKELHGLDAGRCREQQVAVLAQLQGAAYLQPANLLGMLRAADVVVAQERIAGRGGFVAHVRIALEVLWPRRPRRVRSGDHRPPLFRGTRQIRELLFHEADQTYQFFW
jgi:hypothetical protein